MNSNIPTNDRPGDERDYRDWLEEKRQTAAPDGFAERILERLEPSADSPEKRSWGSAALWAKAAVFAIAIAGGLGRYALLFISIFTG